MTELVRQETRGAVRVLTLNRPDKLNAWNTEMHGQLVAAVSDANEDRAVGAIVLTGAGRGFCAGADIGGQFQARLDRGGDQPAPARAARADDEAPASDWVALVRRSKPMIAAVNGAAIGIGLTLVLPFDQLLAGTGAKLSCRFVKMGLTPELASSHFLVQRCGWGAAADLCLSGRMVEADEAARIGLVDRVVAGDALVDEAVALGEEYAANPDPQLRMIKELLTANACETDLRQVQRREIDALGVAYTTAEHREAVAAFLEKRTPTFR